MRESGRCWWANSDALYRAYHDTEWGLPVVDDRRLYEKLTLEGFQAGLSWITILRKRPRFRAAFARFNPTRVARYGARDVRRLLNDAGIIRHRGKIEAAIVNARQVLAIQKEFGSFAAYVWTFAPSAPGTPPAGRVAIPTATAESHALARDLKARGFRFVGPTTVYAFMQSMGLVNDHVRGCPAWRAAAIARARLRPPMPHAASQNRERRVSSPHARNRRDLPSHQRSEHLSARR